MKGSGCCRRMKPFSCPASMPAPNGSSGGSGDWPTHPCPEWLPAAPLAGSALRQGASSPGSCLGRLCPVRKAPGQRPTPGTRLPGRSPSSWPTARGSTQSAMLLSAKKEQEVRGAAVLMKMRRAASGARQLPANPITTLPSCRHLPSFTFKSGECGQLKHSAGRSAERY